MQEALMSQFFHELERERKQNTSLGQIYEEMEKKHFLSNKMQSHTHVLKDKNALSRERLQTVKNYINSHIDDAISLSTLANLVCVSECYFSRLFKRKTGKSPFQYINHCRLEEAKRLLKITGLQITQIALKVGYKNSSYFTLQFKNYTGQTPSYYRKSCVCE